MRTIPTYDDVIVPRKKSFLRRKQFIGNKFINFFHVFLHNKFEMVKKNREDKERKKPIF